jgi:predicted kinase
MQPLLIYTIGLPGSGKTTFARQLAEKINAVHLYGDKIGFEHWGAPTFSAEETRMVYFEMDDMATENLSTGKSVVYDASSNSLASRSRLVELAAELDCVAIGLWIQVDETLARERSSEIRISEFAENYFRIIPEAVFDRAVDVFQPPHTNEIVYTVSGSDSFEEQLKKLTELLAASGIAL